jgi:hypothetical protein
VIGVSPRRILDEGLLALSRRPSRRTPPPRWDGYAAARIVDVLTHAAVQVTA